MKNFLNKFGNVGPYFTRNLLVMNDEEDGLL